jgi:thiol-disulfide isomerase/thioredoxin
MLTTRRALAAAALAATLAACGSGSDHGSAVDNAGPAPTPRHPAVAACPAAGTSSALPHLTLTCLGPGPKVDTTALGGRPVLLNLWASWCGPCRKEMPSLQIAYTRYSSQVSFLGVDTKDDVNSANDFLAAYKVRYPQVVDDNGDLLHQVGASGLPVTIVLDAAGRSVYSHRGELRRTI